MGEVNYKITGEHISKPTPVDRLLENYVQSANAKPVEFDSNGIPIISVNINGRGLQPREAVLRAYCKHYRLDMSDWEPSWTVHLQEEVSKFVREYERIHGRSVVLVEDGETVIDSTIRITIEGNYIKNISYKKH